MSNINVINKDSVTRIILSKPPLNILDIEDMLNLSKILSNLQKKEGLTLIAIESDQKVFSAGVNISDHKIEKISEMLEVFHSIFFAIFNLDVPIISLVKSACIGGGCELALFSDFVLASENAYFSQPEIKLGCFPPVSMVYLPYITGNKKALEMILTGNKVSAVDALNFGLVNQVFSEKGFDSEVEKFINSITTNSASVIKTTLKAYKKLNYAELKEKLQICEKIYLEELMQLEDAQEGLKSFLEKRQPVWTGK